MEAVTPRKPMIYFGSTGLGEMIAQTPVMRQLSLFGYDIVLVAPENLRRYFASLPYVKEFLSREQVGFKDLGERTFRCDSLTYLPGSCYWTGCHYFDWVNGPEGNKKRYTTEGNNYPVRYMSQIFGYEYATELNPNAYYMDAPEVEPYEPTRSVLISRGSFETLRRWHPNILLRLTNIYGEDAVLPDRDMGKALRMIKACDVLICPDSGHFWAALALGKMVVVVPSREHVMSPEVYDDQMFIWSPRNPACAQECRRMTGNLPDGYPMNMKCWNTYPPCMEVDADAIKALVDSLLGRLADKALSSRSLQGVES